MALYTVASGGTIQAADVDQFVQVLTGAMTDQPVTLGNALTVDGAATLQGATAVRSTLNVTGATTLSGGVSGSLSVTGGIVADGGVQAANSGISTTGGGVAGISGLLTASGGITVAGGQTLAISDSAGMAWDKGTWDEATLGGSHTFSRTYTTNFNGRTPAVYCAGNAGGLNNGQPAVPPCTITAASSTGFTGQFSSANDNYPLQFMAIG
jgi:hypothetical protein